MAFCGNCGQRLNDSGICPNCSGQRQTAQPTRQQTYQQSQYPAYQQTMQQPVQQSRNQKHDPTMSVPPAPFAAEPEKPKGKKKKLALWITLGAIALAALIVGGIFLGSWIAGKDEGTDREETSETDKKPEEEKKDDVGGGAEEPPAVKLEPWEELKFTLKGEEYQLPCTMDSFLSNDWEIDDDEGWEEDQSLKKGEEVAVTIENDSDYATLIVANQENSEQELKDCTVIAVRYIVSEDLEFADGVDVTDLESTEDIIDQFGEPQYYSIYGGCVYESDNAIMEVCYTEEYDFIDLSLYTMDAIRYRPSEGEKPVKKEAGREAAKDAQIKDSSGTGLAEAIANGEKPYEGQTLVVWDAYETGTATLEVVDEWIARFEELTGADIQVKHQGRDLSTLLYPALDAGADIDVFSVGSTIQLNLQKDHGLDVTEYFEASDMEERAYPIQMKTIKAVSDDGETIYGIPTVASVNLWWYNKDIFDAAGVTEVPTTIEEFEAVCDKIVAAGYYPLALDDAYAAVTFGYMLGRLVGEDVVAQMTHEGGFANNARFVAACQKIIDWRAKGYFEPNAPGVWPSSQNRIGLMKDTAMVFTGMWLPSEVEDACGERLNWSCFAMPVDPTCADAKIGINPSCTVNMINKNTDTPDLAWDYIYFMNTGEADKAITDVDDYLTNDMTNEALPKFQGAKDALMTAEDTVNYCGGMHDNADIKTSINDVALKLMSGEFKTGLEAAQAFDALVY